MVNTNYKQFINVYAGLNQQKNANPTVAFPRFNQFRQTDVFLKFGKDEKPTDPKDLAAKVTAEVIESAKETGKPQEKTVDLGGGQTLTVKSDGKPIAPPKSS